MPGTSIRINGTLIPFSRGATILAVALRAHAEIPTLCDNPALEPAGHCRVCLVEDLSSGELITACDTEASAGMDILTDSPRVIDARKRILRLILSDHPETCVICEKSNACELRKLALPPQLHHYSLDNFHVTLSDRISPVSGVTTRYPSYMYGYR